MSRTVGRVLGLYMEGFKLFGINITMMILNDGVPSLLIGVNSMDGYEG